MSRGAISLNVILRKSPFLMLRTRYNMVGLGSLTIVSVSGPAEVPEPSITQVEGWLVALPQGGAVPHRQGSVL